MDKDILVQEGLFKGLCGIVQLALRVEGFGMGLQPISRGDEIKIDEDNSYLAHSLDFGLKIRVPVNRIVWDEEHTKRNKVDVHTLMAKGNTVVSYNGTVLSVLKDIHLSSCGHATIWGMYTLLLKWYLSKKVPKDLEGSKKEQWQALGEMTCDDPDYRLGEMIASGSPMILDTIVARFPRESDRALKYYRKYAAKELEESLTPSAE